MVNKFNSKLDGEAAFNSSITYLMRLNYWLQQAHLFSADDDDINDCFMALEQAAIEVDGVCTPEEREELEVLRKETKENILVAINNKKQLFVLREKVRPYHLGINRIAHKKGILMLRAKPEDMSGMI